MEDAETTEYGNRGVSGASHGNVAALAGPAVRELREGLGLTQYDLASKAGVAQGYLSKFERGEVQPSPRWLRDVKEALAASLGGAA